MIDVIVLQPKNAVMTGALRRRMSYVELSSTVAGTLAEFVFPTISPAKMVRWIAAEITGVDDNSTDAVRVRIGDGVDWFYFDESDSLKLKPVTVDDWESQFSSPLAVYAISAWTRSQLAFKIALISTKSFRRPTFTGVAIAMDLPTWEGSVSQAVRRIATAVASIRPILMHAETLSTPTSEWRLGEPHTEIGFVLESVIHVVVDGKHRSAELVDGVVTLKGAAAQAGSTVEIAVTFIPQTTVKRAAESRLVTKLPMFTLEQLVQGGGMNGRYPPMNIGGVEIQRRFVDLQIVVNGVALRQIDALMMRASLQEQFNGSFSVVLDSGRSIGAAVLDLVQMVPSGRGDLPQCSGTVRCPMYEYVSHRRVTPFASPIGDLATNTISILTTPSDDGQTSTAEADSSSFDCPGV